MYRKYILSLVEYPITSETFHDVRNANRRCTGHATVDRTCERSPNYSARTFSCYSAKPKCNFAVCPVYDRSTMSGRLLQTVWVCFFGEEIKTNYCLGIRKPTSI